MGDGSECSFAFCKSGLCFAAFADVAQDDEVGFLVIVGDDVGIYFEIKFLVFFGRNFYNIGRDIDTEHALGEVFDHECFAFVVYEIELEEVFTNKVFFGVLGDGFDGGICPEESAGGIDDYDGISK